MAQYNGFNQTKSLHPELWILDGYVAVNGSGTVLNTGSVSTAPKDVFGHSLLFPRGFSNVAVTGTGGYILTLEQPWYKIEAIEIAIVSASTIAGTMKVKNYNPTAATVNSVTAQTITLQFEQSGSAATFGPGGFFICVHMKNTNIG